MSANRVHPALYELKTKENLSLPALALLLGFPGSTVNSWYYLQRTPRSSQIASIRDSTALSERPISFEDWFPKPEKAR